MAAGDIIVLKEDGSGNYEEVNANDYFNDGKTFIGINAQTGTTYTLVLADAGKLVRCSNAGAITLTVPKNSSVAFPVNTVITIEQQAAGVITLTPVDVDVTINSSAKKTWGQYSVIELQKVGTDIWNVIGGSV